VENAFGMHGTQALGHTFDRIISLGCNCEVTWNLRSCFGFERAYPFDWWITPFQALRTLLENRFQDLFNIRNLEVSDDLLTVRDTHYNLLYHHDFRKTADDTVIVDLIEEQIPALRKKYSMLCERFLHDPRGKRVLFVRNRDGNIPHLHHDSTPMDPDTFEQLYSVLEGMFPGSRISLLVTNCPVFPTIKRENGYIAWDEISDYGDGQFFAGSPRGWQELFSRNHISFMRIYDESSPFSRPHRISP